MAPLDQPDHNTVERQLKDVIQILYEIMIQVTNYDAHLAPTSSSNTPNGNSTPLRTPIPTTTTTSSSNAPPTREVLASQLNQLSSALQSVHRVSTHPSAPTALPSLPFELIQYVEGGRNPDIYTREFVELVRRQNQLMRGKMRAFGDFRDVLAREMGEALPELREDVGRVVQGTGHCWTLQDICCNGMFALA
ncbi:Mediator of RNA polymerase II transcription subunit 10 [Cytospora mali]|uniref:Mediator of RNA polymerase II transcription subunit 10 n=1 Tax=Cytospora mali TaxID=578113 RepID=A0A194UV48_CYTMA|nr:Mediator of RNA polymerase II transcription subunit 10 [Valsa mali var. pyri (nom. inval.)]